MNNIRLWCSLLVNKKNLVLRFENKLTLTAGLSEKLITRLVSQLQNHLIKYYNIHNNLYQ